MLSRKTHIIKLYIYNAILKAEYIWIEFKKYNNIFERFLLRVLWLYIIFTFV